MTAGTLRENASVKVVPKKVRIRKVQALQSPYNWKGVQIHSKKLWECCKLNNLQLHIWTVNTTHKFQHCLDIGCDGVITDEPIVLRNYLNSKSYIVLCLINFFASENICFFLSGSSLSNERVRSDNLGCDW